MAIQHQYSMSSSSSSSELLYSKTISTIDNTWQERDNDNKDAAIITAISVEYVMGAQSQHLGRFDVFFCESHLLS
jgi:hypothetical protein